MDQTAIAPYIQELLTKGIKHSPKELYNQALEYNRHLVPLYAEPTENSNWASWSKAKPLTLTAAELRRLQQETLKIISYSNDPLIWTYHKAVTSFDNAFDTALNGRSNGFKGSSPNQQSTLVISDNTNTIKTLLQDSLLDIELHYKLITLYLSKQAGTVNPKNVKQVGTKLLSYSTCCLKLCKQLGTVSGAIAFYSGLLCKALNYSSYPETDCIKLELILERLSEPYNEFVNQPLTWVPLHIEGSLVTFLDELERKIRLNELLLYSVKPILEAYGYRLPREY